MTMTTTGGFQGLRGQALATTHPGRLLSWGRCISGEEGGGGVLGLPVLLARFSPAVLASPAPTQPRERFASATARERITTSTCSHKLHWKLLSAAPIFRCLVSA